MKRNYQHRHSTIAIAGLLVFMAAGTPAAHAQSLEDRLRDQLRTQMNQVQQLQEQQASLQAAKVAAEKERDDLKAQLATAKEQLAHAHASRSTVDVQKETELEAQVTQFKDQATQAAGTVQQAQADRDKAQKALDELQKKLGVCEDKNAKLFKTGNEILDAYQQFDMGDAIGANEPLIGVKRVELENEAQGFDDRLHEGKYDPNARMPAAAPAGGKQ